MVAQRFLAPFVGVRVPTGQRLTNAILRIAPLKKTSKLLAYGRLAPLRSFFVLVLHQKSLRQVNRESCKQRSDIPTYQCLG